MSSAERFASPAKKELSSIGFINLYEILAAEGLSFDLKGFTVAREPCSYLFV